MRQQLRYTIVLELQTSYQFNAWIFCSDLCSDLRHYDLDLKVLIQENLIEFLV